MGILKSTKKLPTIPFISLPILLIATSRIFTFFAYPNPIHYPDSPTYYSGKFLNFDLVSLQGDAARGWFVPLIYSLMPSTRVLELFQLGFSAVAWTILIKVVYESTILKKRFLDLTVIALAILASAPQVIQHDTNILATSITNSLFILMLAYFMKLITSEPRNPKNLFLILTVGMILVVQKLTFLPVIIVILLIAYFAVGRSFRSGIKQIFFVLSFCFLASSLYVGSNVNNSWQVSYSGQTLLWQLGGQSPVAADFRNYLKNKNAPQCITEEAPYENLDKSIGLILNECPEGVEFIKTTIQKEFFTFLASNPAAPLKLGIIGLGAAMTNSAANYGNAVSILPDFTSAIFFGTTAPNIALSGLDSQVAGFELINSGAAFWIYAPLMGWVLLAAFGLLTQIIRTHNERLLFLVLLSCLGQALLAVVLLPSEWVRQTSPFILGALVTSVILSSKVLEIIVTDSANFDK